MTSVKAYILGLAWADGWIRGNDTGFALSSKDEELEKIRHLVYPNGRPLEVRKDGVKLLVVYSGRIGKELQAFGFQSQKSYHGRPVIPSGFEKYFLLGLLDGDGCIALSKGQDASDRPTLRIYYSGNQETMDLIRDTIMGQTGILFAQRSRQNSKERYIGDVKINDHAICTILDLPSTEKSVKYLEWLYSDIEGVPFFQRKFSLFKQFLEIWNPNVSCSLCGCQVPHHGTAIKYCIDCRVLLRRLRNRQQDHLKRKGTRFPLSSLLTEQEKALINIPQSGTLSGFLA